MPADDHAYIVRKGEDAEGAIVELDGNWFEGCTFTDCTLIFRGIQPFGYAKTQFAGCSIRLMDHALLTVDRLAAMLGTQFTDSDLRTMLHSLAAGTVRLQ